MNACDYRNINRKECDMSNASVDVSLGAVFSHTTSLIVKFSSPPANAMTDGKKYIRRAYILN